MKLTGRQAARIYAQWHLDDPVWADNIIHKYTADDPYRALLVVMTPEEIDAVHQEANRGNR